ncbi:MULTISPECIES: hypothetical protein [Streptomyces]|uniref:hypothetical protein n=1 Tax=Streptomyces TaxID=1883 RepID=UPI00099E6A58|nr:MULTISPECIES: hypothetical protein [Streptomyces]MDI5904912.1 hypothetical protein [Streptomyces sp. 12257]
MTRPRGLDLPKTAPRRGAVLLALRYCGRELARLLRPTVPAMVLSAPGGIGLDYIVVGGAVHDGHLQYLLQ